MEIRKCLYEDDFTYPREEVHCHLYNVDFPQMHTHDYWEFFLIVNGSVIHKTEKKEEKLSRCDLFLIRPFDSHCFKKPYEAGYEEMTVMVTDDLFRTLSATIHPTLYEKIVKLPEPVKIKIGEPERKQFLDDLHMIQTCKNKDAGVMRSMVIFMYVAVLKHIYLQLVTSRHHYPQWMNDFIAKLQQPENIALPVEELYRLTHFSHSHLIKLFKSYTGDSLKHYLTELKMNYAAGLLQTTDLLVLDIAMKLGYSSLSHFNRSFKQYFSLTPSEYRKGIRKKV